LQTEFFRFGLGGPFTPSPTHLPPWRKLESLFPLVLTESLLPVRLPRVLTCSVLKRDACFFFSLPLFFFSLSAHIPFHRPAPALFIFIYSTGPGERRDAIPSPFLSFPGARTMESETSFPRSIWIVNLGDLLFYGFHRPAGQCLNFRCSGNSLRAASIFFFFRSLFLPLQVRLLSLFFSKNFPFASLVLPSSDLNGQGCCQDSNTAAWFLVVTGCTTKFPGHRPPSPLSPVRQQAVALFRPFVFLYEGGQSSDPVAFSFFNLSFRPPYWSFSFPGIDPLTVPSSDKINLVHFPSLPSWLFSPLYPSVPLSSLSAP